MNLWTKTLILLVLFNGIKYSVTNGTLGGCDQISYEKSLPYFKCLSDKIGQIVDNQLKPKSRLPNPLEIPVNDLDVNNQKGLTEEERCCFLFLNLCTNHKTIQLLCKPKPEYYQLVEEKYKNNTKRCKSVNSLCKKYEKKECTDSTFSECEEYSWNPLSENTETESSEDTPTEISKDETPEGESPNEEPPTERPKDSPKKSKELQTQSPKKDKESTGGKGYSFTPNVWTLWLSVFVSAVIVIHFH